MHECSTEKLKILSPGKGTSKGTKKRHAGIQQPFEPLCRQIVWTFTNPNVGAVRSPFPHPPSTIFQNWLIHVSLAGGGLFPGAMAFLPHFFLEGGAPPSRERGGRSFLHQNNLWEQKFVWCLPLPENQLWNIIWIIGAWWMRGRTRGRDVGDAGRNHVSHGRTSSVGPPCLLWKCLMRNAHAKVVCSESSYCSDHPKNVKGKLLQKVLVFASQNRQEQQAWKNSMKRKERTPRGKHKDLEHQCVFCHFCSQCFFFL